MRSCRGRGVLGVFCFLCFASAGAWQAAQDTPGNLVDITAGSGVRFEHVASYTSRKYLPETMAPGWRCSTMTTKRRTDQVGDILVREQVKQYGVDHAIHRRDGADPERDGTGGHEHQTGTLPQVPHPETDVTREVLEESKPRRLPLSAFDEHSPF